MDRYTHYYENVSDLLKKDIEDQPVLLHVMRRMDSFISSICVTDYSFVISNYDSEFDIKIIFNTTCKAICSVQDCVHNGIKFSCGKRGEWKPVYDSVCDSTLFPIREFLLDQSGLDIEPSGYDNWYNEIKNIFIAKLEAAKNRINDRIFYLLKQPETELAYHEFFRNHLKREIRKSLLFYNKLPNDIVLNIINSLYIDEVHQR